MKFKKKTIDIINKVKKQKKFLKKTILTALKLVSNKLYSAEVLIKNTDGINVSTNYGNIENIEFKKNKIFKITIFSKNRKGVAFSNDLNRNAIINTVNSALKITQNTSSDPYSGISEKNLLAFKIKNLDLFHPIELNIKRISSICALAEKSALEKDKRIIYTEGGQFNSYINTIAFGNSYGMLQIYNNSYHSLSCSVVAKNNLSMERNYAYTVGCSLKDLKSPQSVGKECAFRTLRQLNPLKIKTTEAPVIFISEIASELFDHLVDAIDGYNIYRKSTFLLNSLGKKIFPEWISIDEYPHVHRSLYSSPFDSEGIKTYQQCIIQNGILKTWLLDTYSSRKLGLKSTGHASGIHNWYVSNQNLSFCDLLKKMKCGLLITTLMGQGVNIITGDYSRGANGFWIENGEIKFPISEVTISGNLNNMFNNIESISNDIETRSNIKCGSILISNMIIAGN